MIKVCTRLIMFTFLFAVMTGCYVSGNITDKSAVSSSLPPPFQFEEVRVFPDVVAADRITTTLGTPGYTFDAILFENIEPTTTSNGYQILGVYQ